MRVIQGTLDLLQPISHRTTVASEKTRFPLKTTLIATLLAWQPVSTLATEFAGLGDVPGGGFGSYATGISADGVTVVGTGLTANATGAISEAFIWTASGGLQSLGIPASGATGVSSNGSVVAGYFYNTDHTEAFRWTATGGIQPLGLAGGFGSSMAEAISGDGNTVVGIASGSGMQEAFAWTEAGGMVGLGHVAGGAVTSQAWGVSYDGSVIVGADRMAAGGMQAFRYTSSGGMEGLGYLAPGQIYSNAYAVSADGNVIVGEASNGSGLVEAMRWTAEDGMTGLGFLPGHDTSWARAASANGSVIVGASQIDGDWSNTMAFRWTQANGMQDLNKMLIQSGVNLGSWRLHVANGVSADGNTIVGQGTNPDGNSEAFIAKVDALIGLTDFSNSVASLHAVLQLPTELARASVANEVPGLYGLRGISAAPVYQHVSGSRGDLGGAALTWRDEGIAVSGQVGRIDARTASLHDGGRSKYRGWWVGGAASLGLDKLLNQPAIAGLELDSALRWGHNDTEVNRNYLNGIVAETAHGHTSSRDFTALARIGWRRDIGAGISVRPYVQLLHSRVHVNGYAESGGTMSGIVSSQHLSNRETSVGVNAAWQVRPDLQLRGRYSYNHLNNRNRTPITVTVAGLGTFAAGGESNDANWHEISVGAEWSITDKVRLNASTTRTSGSNYPENWSLSVALNFGL